MTPYETYNNQIGVRLSFLVKKELDEAKQVYMPHDDSLQLLSYGAYEKRASRHSNLKLRAGKGKGNEVLIAWNYIQSREPDWKDVLVESFGNPEISYNPLQDYFEVDGAARLFFDTYQQIKLTPEQISQYTINASTFNAFAKLKKYRASLHKGKGNGSNGLWPGLISDLKAFKGYLKKEYGYEHTLPLSERNLRPYFTGMIKFSYEYFIDNRGRQANAAKVTPIMVQLWKDIYAGQRGQKPDHTEVWRQYELFLAGKIDILIHEDGEAYDRNNESFVSVDRTTVYNYQSLWENRAATHSKRSGNRQRFLGEYIPHGKMIQPKYAGSIISVDDRQPPFKYAAGGGNRMWFYLAQDLGSEAFTAWVYGDTKEGIIDAFYKQIVVNYAQWGISMPDAIECESSLNSSFKDTYLAPGAMFQNVRIIANDARSKRIEREFEELRYRIESKEPGFIPRINNRSEHNQERADNIPFIAKEDIVRMELRLIAEHNNTLHSNQELHKGLTRWDVFMDKQHPKLSPTNWLGFMPHLGYREETSMKLGRVKLQHKGRVVGTRNFIKEAGMVDEVFLGDKLINVMSEIEGKDVDVYWIGGSDGEVLKAMVYDKKGMFVCELLDDLPYQRAPIEQSSKCKENITLTAAYRGTVEGYIRRTAKEINNITIINNEPKKLGTRFVMPGLEIYTPSTAQTKELPNINDTEDDDLQDNLNDFNKAFNTSTASRF